MKDSLEYTIKHVVSLSEGKGDGEVFSDAERFSKALALFYECYRGDRRAYIEPQEYIRAWFEYYFQEPMARECRELLYAVEHDADIIGAVWCSYYPTEQMAFINYIESVEKMGWCIPFLYQALEDYLRDNSCRYIMLEQITISECAYYEKLGFKILLDNSVYFQPAVSGRQGEELPLYLMVKDITYTPLRQPQVESIIRFTSITYLDCWSGIDKKDLYATGVHIFERLLETVKLPRYKPRLYSIDDYIDYLSKSGPMSEYLARVKGCRIPTIEAAGSVDQRTLEHMNLMAHQLVAPLFALRTHADNLLEGRISPSRAKVVLTSIRAQARIAARLASNFALISLILSGGIDELREQIRLVNVSLSRVFVDLAKDYQSMAWMRDINIVVDTLSLPEARVDERTFPQAAANIIDNAVKYSEPYTDIVIHGEFVHNESGGRRISVYIENKGIELPREEAEKIFQPGYRTREATMRFPAGTGLGVGLARDILRLHGGELTVVPTDSQGITKFAMEIPLP